MSLVIERGYRLHKDFLNIIFRILFEIVMKKDHRECFLVVSFIDVYMVLF